MESSVNTDEDYRGKSHGNKQSNVLPIAGNERTMNLNPLILTNIQSSHYFKVNLYELKTYHEVVDEIYYKVNHLEPWEKGSRRTSGQTGMCGGVRGVGAGGIVSTAYCLLYKLFTLKLTRKQLNGLINHCDSPFIRGLGFMYVRYALPPKDLLDWYEPYFDDEEEIDVKAGGGQVMTIGQMLKQWLTSLDWFSTLFPRIPVPIQQTIQRRLAYLTAQSAVASDKTRSERDLPRNEERSSNTWHQRDKYSTYDRNKRGDRRDDYRKYKDKSPYRDRSPRSNDISNYRDRKPDSYKSSRSSSSKYH